MKRLPSPLMFFLLVVLWSSGLRANDAQSIAAVRTADDERIAATLAADTQRLAAILSDELRYAHSSGKVDTKASFVDSLTTHNTVYESIEYGQRDFRLISPTVALMSGRAKVKVRSAGQKIDLDLVYLAVWREEAGRWRFLAWQSTRFAVPAVVAPTDVKATIDTR